MIDKYVAVVVSHFNGSLIQLSSIVPLSLGISLNLETIGLILTVLLSLSGFIVTVISTSKQKKVFDKEMEVAEREIEHLKIQNEIHKIQHPELFTKTPKK